MLQGVLKRQGIDHGGEHAHVMGGGRGDRFAHLHQVFAADDVATATDDGQLDAVAMNVADLFGNPRDFLEADAGSAR